MFVFMIVLPNSITAQSMVFVNASPDITLSSDFKMTSSESTGTVSAGESPIPPNMTAPLFFIGEYL